MTFFIPPVFLFGNNVNRFHNNEEEKSEYKTAAETEIKVENWRAKRIAELEEENKKLNIKVASLEGEIKGLNSVIDKLKEENQTLELWLDRKEKLNEKYRNEIDELKFRESIADVLPEGKGHIAEETIQDLQKRIDELVWFEKEYHRSRDRIKKLEWILEHEYGRKVPC